MSDVLWMNIPLMVLFFALTAGVPLWLVLRRRDWHGKPEDRTIPAYLVARRVARARSEESRRARNARLAMRPLGGGANS